jgi:hypothetical protein
MGEEGRGDEGFAGQDGPKPTYPNTPPFVRITSE